LPARLRPLGSAWQPAAGPVAQWLEPAAHNGLVAGSSPAGPTSLRWLRQLRLGEPYRSEGCRAEAQRAKAGASQISDLIFQTATTICVCRLAARCARVMQGNCPRKSEGAGNTGCTLHPRSRVQIAHRKTHTSIQVQAEQSGIPCAMALRLITGSPRRRIRLVTVASELTVHQDPVGPRKPPPA
jgi:hypothetical protein